MQAADSFREEGGHHLPLLLPNGLRILARRGVREDHRVAPQTLGHGTHQQTRPGEPLQPNPHPLHRPTGPRRLGGSASRGGRLLRAAAPEAADRGDEGVPAPAEQPAEPSEQPAPPATNAAAIASIANTKKFASGARRRLLAELNDEDEKCEAAIDKTNPNEIEINIDAIDAKTFDMLDQYVRECLGETKKGKKRKAGGAGGAGKKKK